MIVFREKKGIPGMLIEHGILTCSVRRVPAGGQRGSSRVSAMRAGCFPVPRPVPLFSLKPVSFPHLVG